jgi:general stress protein 26
MKESNLNDISSKMRKLDICMMSTQTLRGNIASRPMSNNGDVEYDGNSYFFSFNESRAVKALEENAHVNLSFNGKNGLYISLSGKAKLVTDRAKLEKHWQDQLNQWFSEGINTKGIVMIHVKASHIKYWQGDEDGEVKL